MTVFISHMKNSEFVPYDLQEMNRNVQSRLTGTSPFETKPKGRETGMIQKVAYKSRYAQQPATSFFMHLSVMPGQSCAGSGVLMAKM